MTFLVFSVCFSLFSFTKILLPYTSGGERYGNPINMIPTYNTQPNQQIPYEVYYPVRYYMVPLQYYNQYMSMQSLYVPVVQYQNYGQTPFQYHQASYTVPTYTQTNYQNTPQQVENEDHDSVSNCTTQYITDKEERKKNYNREYKKRNKERINEYYRKYYKKKLTEDPKSLRGKNALRNYEYRKRHKEKINERYRSRYQIKKQTDPEYYKNKSRMDTKRKREKKMIGKNKTFIEKNLNHVDNLNMVGSNLHTKSNQIFTEYSKNEHANQDQIPDKDEYLLGNYQGKENEENQIFNQNVKPPLMTDEVVMSLCLKD